MKQGKKSRVDEGWQRLQPILDQELPQKEKKRRALWLWLLPMLLGAAGIGYMFLGSQSSKSEETLLSTAHTTPLATNSPATNYDHSKIETETTNTSDTQNITKKDNITGLLASDLSKQQPQKKIPANTTSNTRIKNHNPNHNSSTSSHNPSTRLRPTLAQNTNTIKQTIEPEKTNIPSQLLSKQTGNAKSAMQSSTNSINPIPFIDKLPYLVLSTTATELRIVNASNFSTSATHTTLAQLPKTKMLEPSLNLLTFFAPQMNSAGLEIGLALDAQKNNWHYGINFGAGYYFSQYTTITTLSDGSRIAEDNFDPGGLSSANAPNSSLPNYQSYVMLGITGGRSIKSNLSISGLIGLEKYFFMSTQSDDSHADLEDVPVTLGNMDSETENLITPPRINHNSWNPISQLSASYILGSWSLGLGYRTSFGSLFKIEGNNKYKAHKLFVTLKKSF